MGHLLAFRLRYNVSGVSGFHYPSKSANPIGLFRA
jgi:hypothetical protein